MALQSLDTQSPELVRYPHLRSLCGSIFAEDFDSVELDMCRAVHSSWIPVVGPNLRPHFVEFNASADKGWKVEVPVVSDLAHPKQKYDLVVYVSRLYDAPGCPTPHRHVRLHEVVSKEHKKLVYDQSQLYTRRWTLEQASMAENRWLAVETGDGAPPSQVTHVDLKLLDGASDGDKINARRLWPSKEGLAPCLVTWAVVERQCDHSIRNSNCAHTIMSLTFNLRPPADNHQKREQVVKRKENELNLADEVRRMRQTIEGLAEVTLTLAKKYKKDSCPRCDTNAADLMASIDNVIRALDAPSEPQVAPDNTPACQ